MQNPQKVHVLSADGSERELVLLRVVGKTAYVCNEVRLRETLGDPDADIEIGVSVRDVREMREAAN